MKVKGFCARPMKNLRCSGGGGGGQVTIPERSHNLDRVGNDLEQ